VLAGVVASYVIMLWMNGSGPSVHELMGAGLIVQAILFLTLPTLFAKKST
jgi:hypothetical protein